MTPTSSHTGQTTDEDSTDDESTDSSMSNSASTEDVDEDQEIKECFSDLVYMCCMRA